MNDMIQAIVHQAVAYPLQTFFMGLSLVFLVLLTFVFATCERHAPDGNTHPVVRALKRTRCHIKRHLFGIHRPS